jgi:hypothetical protein
MKKSLILMLSLAAVGGALATTNIGVSIGIGGPGQYGRIDINNYPQPVLVMPQPVVVMPTPVAVYQRPIYLYVPSTHRNDWRRYCGQYGACGQPVYFVQESWVRERYAKEHPHQHGKKNGHGKHKNKHD